MTDIKVIVDGHEYSESQFKKDLTRYIEKNDWFYNRKDEKEYFCSEIVRNKSCANCAFYNKDFQLRSCANSAFASFSIVKRIFVWAHEHPVITNEDMLKKTFGEDVFNHICARVFEQDWFDQEYKDTKGDQKK